ncbi:MAG: phosphoribosylanthranilate isomerase [Planctomycetota bacterium]|jgi:phosphoribosylanthranilate isomerase
MTRFFQTLFTGSERPLAKVCGVTRQADIQPIAGAGADFIGLVSCPASPRHLTDLLVVALANSVRQAGVRSILVTVDADRAAVDQLVHEARLDGVQLCGMEPPSDWRNTAYGLMRRVGVDEHGFAEIEDWRGIADGFVLDHPASAGGSGEQVDLVLASRLAEQAPCFLAGGLWADAAVFAGEGSGEAPGGSAVGTAGSFVGFDASSRLESAPGAKDMERVTRFVTAAHSYPRNAPFHTQS